MEHARSECITDVTNSNDYLLGNSTRLYPRTVSLKNKIIADSIVGWVQYYGVSFVSNTMVRCINETRGPREPGEEKAGPMLRGARTS